MPVDPTVGRHYLGARPKDLDRSAWKCPTCGTQQTTPFEDGCPSCGAGTAEEVERARLQRMEGLPSEEHLIARLLTAQTTDAGAVLRMVGWSERARTSLARALAFYAEQSTPLPTECSRAELLGWARLLIEE